jgi:hypothetical protein
VVSRAALSDTELRDVAGPLLRPGGLLVAYRGDSTDPAVAADADPDGKASGFGVATLHHYELRRPSRRFALRVRERICFT